MEGSPHDAVRTYLRQMGRISLLTRKQEIVLAKQIDYTRTELRRLLLGCDYVMRKRLRCSAEFMMEKSALIARCRCRRPTSWTGLRSSAGWLTT